jgi:cytochrome c oxidase accessory protein FixG
VSGWTTEHNEQVLSTMNADGTRHWLRPIISPGRFLNLRRWVGYFLIALFIAIPFIKINGKPLILLDVTAREFTFFGQTFLPTDTLLLAIFMVGFIVSIFLITALLGRVWCGWMCPQLVYLEFVYRPIEYFLEGKPGFRGTRGKRANALRTILKYAIYLVISLFLAHIFLAYFVSIGQLSKWLFESPFQHPLSFFAVWITTGLMMFDFCFFREQTCVLACPYGRFQSVMLDKDSLIISYDESRGEPRGRLQKTVKEGETQHGDCIDCDMCVETCPTGIDIRQGLQLECVACAQCIDACDAVMEKVKKPRGLIRYSSQARMSGEGARILRPRVIVYPLILLVLATGFVFTLTSKAETEAKLLRSRGRPYFEKSPGQIANQARLRITNRTNADVVYTAEILGETQTQIILDKPTIEVQAGGTQVVGALIVTPVEEFVDGRHDIKLEITGDNGDQSIATYQLMGPRGKRTFPPPAEKSSDGNE